MKTKLKKIAAALLCLCLSVTAAYAADYAPDTEAFGAKTIIDMFAKLMRQRGAVPEPQWDGDAEPGGSVYLCADAFVLGGDYVIYPMKVEFDSGANAASVVAGVLDRCEIYYEHSGNYDEGFYLRRLGGVDLTPNPNADLVEWLKPVVSYYEPENWETGSLGEFDFTDMSGWMFFVNGEMMSVGMSDYAVQDGDVISLRFTLTYGMDLGGASFIEGAEPYGEIVNRDEAAKAIAEGRLNYSDCADVLSDAAASQEEIDEILRRI